MARSGAVIAAVAFVGVTAAAVAWGPSLLDHGTQAPPPRPRCFVTVTDGTYELSLEAANNAALISGVAFQRGYGTAGLTVALATAIQESGLRNLNYGDRDSLGLFQQRPSQGWGTEQEVTDPYIATQRFYAALEKVDGWEQMRVTDAAQAVQRSGFPEAYADHEGEARAWARAFTGEGAATVTCVNPAVQAHPAQVFIERLAADLGPSYQVDVAATGATEMVLGVRPLDDSDASLQGLQAWAVASASGTGVTWVDLAGARWHADGSWTSEKLDAPWAAYQGVRVGIATG